MIFTWQVPVVKNAILALLNANAASRFTVEGYQRQTHAAEELVGNLRHVSVFYRQGAFDKTASGWEQGPFKHGMTFAVELVLAAASSSDLSALNNPTATPQQRISALAASIEAAAAADALWDELAGIIWGILMDPVNDNLGLTTIGIADRWIASLSKSAPPTEGEFVLLAGTMDYTCTVNETPAGVTPVPAGVAAVDVTLNETADITGAAYDSAQQGAKSQ